MDVPTSMLVCDKLGPGVILSGVWSPIPIDEWQLNMDPRKVEEFRKKWKKDTRAALRELDGSVGSPDPLTKTQQRVWLEKAALHLPCPHEFPLDLATGALGHTHTPMKLEEKFENGSFLESELGNPIVDESDSAATTEQKPMKMEKQEKHAPPRPLHVPQAGSQKASNMSLTMMLLKAQHTLKERVATNDTKGDQKESSQKSHELETQKVSQYSPKLDFHHNDPQLAQKERGKAQYQKKLEVLE